MLQPIQVELHKKLMNFCQISNAFLNLHKGLNCLKKKDESQSLNIYEIIESGRRGYLNI